MDNWKSTTPPPPSLLNSVISQAPNTIMEDPPYSPSQPTYGSFPSYPSSSITPQCFSVPQHHFFPRDLKSHTSLPRDPTPRNAYPPIQAHQKPSGSGFRPCQHARMKRLLKRGKALTPIGVSYASLFERIRHAGSIETLPACTINPLARSLDPAARCAYHSNVIGHNIESCHSWRREVEKMVREGRVVIIENLLTEVDDVEAGNSLGSIDAKFSG